MNQPDPAQMLPSTGYVRLHQILGNPQSLGIPPLIPICRSSWYQKVRAGVYPVGVLLGPRTRAWRVEDIRALIDNTNAGAR